jgi:hypothetical protein
MDTTEIVINGLHEYITVYVPSTQSLNQAISEDEYTSRVDYTAGLLSELFGGATLTPSIGYYKDHTGKIVKENITQVKAYTNHITDGNLEKVIAHANELKARYAQEAISIEINNTLLFI